MFRVLRVRDYRLLWLAQTTSLLGDVMMLVARPFWVWRLTGSGGLTAAMFVLETGAPLVVGPWAGVFVDRWDRRRVMVWVDVLRGLALLPMFLVADSSGVWLLFLSTGIAAALGALFEPARFAIVPAVLGEDPELVAAGSGVAASTESLLKIVGPALGGMLYGLIGPLPVVALDAVSFWVSAGLVRAVRAPGASGAAGAHADRAAVGVWRELVAGARYLGRNRTLAALVGVMFAFSAGDAMFVAALPLFADLKLGLGAAGMGLVLACFGLGQMSATPLGYLASRRLAARLSVGGGMLVAAAALACAINGGGRVGPLAWAALAGAGAGVAVVSAMTLMQLLIDASCRGRVWGLHQTLMLLAATAAGAAASLMVGRMGAAVVLNCGVGCFAVGAALAAAALGRRAATAARPTPAPASSDRC